MKDLFEESTKSMQKTWSQWEKMVSEFPYPDKPNAFFMQWNPGVAAVRSTFDINMKAWKTFIDHNETTFFKVLEITPFRNEMAETQLRTAWDSVKKAIDSYQQIMEAQFEKMEGSIK
jgi:hypothetical protein